MKSDSIYCKPLETARLILSPLRVENKNDIQLIVANKEVRENILSPVLDDPEAYKIWWDKRMEAMDRKELFHWCVYLKDGMSFCGLLTIKEISISNQRAELGYSFLPAFWGQGLATEASQVVVEYVFNELNFHSLFAQVLDNNIGSQKILSKLGFREEGRFQDCHEYKGKFYPLLQFGKLNPKHIL